jgi:hypothetical protein
MSIWKLGEIWMLTKLCSGRSLLAKIGATVLDVELVLGPPKDKITQFKVQYLSYCSVTSLLMTKKSSLT